MTQETDRELLEWAARAAGYGYQWDDDVFCVFDCGFWHEWNPLTDDGDALRLAVKLDIEIKQCEPSTSMYPRTAVYSKAPSMGHGWIELYNGDPYAATRRAIVRAAAEIGKAM